MKRLLSFMLCAVSLGVGAQTTFNVDMTCAPEFDNVFVTGPWCGWCANEEYNTMTDPDGDGIYTVFLDESVAGAIEYKYAINGFANQENLVNDMVDGASCAPITDYNVYANRQTTQGTVNNDYYGTCDGVCNDQPYEIGTTVLDIVVDSDQHTILESAIFTTDLVPTLSGDGPFTVFAPTDDAFAVLPPAVLEATLADNDLLVPFLLTHVVGAVGLSADLSNGMVITNLNGQDLILEITVEGVFINNAQIVVADIVADNGVVHVIDAVLSPSYLGCTDASACNYNAATEDDGSCLYLDALGVCGGECFEADSSGTCLEEILFGCLDSTACNYSILANSDDGSCLFEDACGCTDGNACNYDFQAVSDDGSCQYFDAIGVCGGDCVEDANADGICDNLLNCVNIGAAFWQDLELGAYLSEPTPITPDSLPIDGIQLTVGEDFTNELILNVPLVFVDEVTGGAFQVLSWSNLTAEGLPPGVELILPQDLEGGSQACVELTGDDYPTLEGFYEVVITGEVLLNIFGAPFSIGDVSTSFWIEVVSNPNGVPGCTYPTASNYMPWATYDNGVCEFAGCTDPIALNYSPRHSVDDGSCFYNDPNCVAEAACPEDLNGDGAVGTPDLLLMLGEYGNFCE